MDLLTWVALSVGLIVVGMLLQYFFGTRIILKAHEALEVERNIVSAAKNEVEAILARIREVEASVVAKAEAIKKAL